MAALPRPALQNASLTENNRVRLGVLLRRKVRNRKARLLILHSTDGTQFSTIKKIPLKRFYKKRRFSVNVLLPRKGQSYLRSRISLPNGKVGPVGSSQSVFIEEEEVVDETVIWPKLPAGLSECPIEYESDALRAVNRRREAAGAAPLKEDFLLTVAARNHTMKMARKQKLSHEGWFDEVLSLGLAASHYSQNIAHTFRTGEGVVTAWMQSPSHAENILHPKDVRTGISCIADAKGNFWWSQNFSN